MLKYLDAFLYTIFTALSFVFLDKIIAHINPIIALAVMSLCGIIVFNLLNAKRTRQTYIFCFEHKKTYLIMSFALAVDWWTMVLSSYTSDPFVAMAALFIALALVGFLKLWLKHKNIYFLISCVLLIFASILLICVYQVPIHKSSLIGFILGFIAGCAFFVYVASSEQLTIKGNLNSMQILATRFWLLFISAIIGIFFLNYIKLTFIDLVKLILISFGSLIIPIYFNQQSILKLGAEKTSIFISLVPPITYVFYISIYHEIKLINTLVCLLITTAIFIPKIIRNRVI